MLSAISIAPDWLWIGFIVSIVILLIIDLSLFGKGEHAPSRRMALIESGIWVSIGLIGHKLPSKAGKELTELSSVMENLLPQMWHFLKTGFVAKKKIIHLKMADIYSIVRGKAGKQVEFGIKWGINRIGGGFVQGFTLTGNKHASDLKFCQNAWMLHEETFGSAPKTFGFDRGGYSKANIKKAKKAGIKHVGIAPKGKAAWEVGAKRAENIRCERAQVEGVIGSLKTTYGFNKPNARSTSAMVRYGQRAILGFNMRKLVRECTAMEAAAAN